METKKKTAFNWFKTNYLGPYIVLALILPITGLYFALAGSILLGIITIAASLAIAIGTFRIKVRADYYEDVIKFKGVERWKSDFLHLLFLPPLKKK